MSPLSVGGVKVDWGPPVDEMAPSPPLARPCLHCGAAEAVQRHLCQGCWVRNQRQAQALRRWAAESRDTFFDRGRHRSTPQRLGRAAENVAAAVVVCLAVGIAAFSVIRQVHP